MNHLHLDYLKALSRLPIMNPTDDDLKLLCPHLTPETAITELRYGTYCLAIPSLRVSGCFQSLRLVRETSNRPDLRLVTGWAFKEGTNNGKIIPYATEALAFARSNWMDELLDGIWPAIGTFRIINLETLKPIASVVVALNRTYSGLGNDIINDRSAPKSKLVEGAILHVETDAHAALEMTFDRRAHHFDCCQFCGGGLTYAVCTGCGCKLNSSGRTGDQCPLPKSVEGAIVRMGIIFDIDPQVARDKEEQEWKRRFKIS